MPAVETFKNVPELFEGTYEESIKVRSETLSKQIKRKKRREREGSYNCSVCLFCCFLGTFKHLGPDDLVHVVKNIPNSRQHIKEVN